MSYAVFCLQQTGPEVGVKVLIVGPLETPPGGSTNKPLTTAFTPPVLVTRNTTLPWMFHTRYCPPVKPLTVLVSRTVFVTGSTTSTVCTLPRESQSIIYSAT